MEPVANGSLIPAAEYVRKSTDHQRYSTENQSDAIRAYAAQHGMVIVRTYSDAGKSGLSINRRTALKQLLDHVQTGQADFRTILVYDVSRWGRFQDADESGYYEYICKRAGVNVEYCAEQFANDGSLIAAIIKALKRAMAAEYSRELSVKTFAGLSRIVELGFRPGGTAGYGYRRLLVDPNGKAKCVLANGERKSIANERIKLVPGPIQEVETVRWIFSTFVQDRKSEFQIATMLNNQGVLNSAGGRWTHRMVNMLLRNEKYIGNNVWNRTSFKLQTKHLRNSPDMWLRADCAFLRRLLLIDIYLMPRRPFFLGVRYTPVAADAVDYQMMKCWKRYESFGQNMATLPSPLLKAVTASRAALYIDCDLEG